MAAPDESTVTSLRPLCVDLDGTLVRTDTLWEAIAGLVKRRPWLLFLLPVWLMGGRARMKREVSCRFQLDPALLPYRSDLLDFLKQEREAGRRIVLATAADKEIAEGVADYVGLFDEVIASDGESNLKGTHKREHLVERFGEGGYCYAGDSPSDLPVWRGAGSAIPVGVNAQVNRQIANEGFEVERQFVDKQRFVRAMIKLLRPHQWAKNVLVLVPLLLAQQFDLITLSTVFLSFCCFTLCSSGVYALNDLMDVNSDRIHPTKRKRPLASGELPLVAAAVAVPILTILAFVGSSFLPPQHTIILSCYLVLTLAYSLKLKQLPLADVFTLAALYTIRILAGGAATGIPISFHTLAFSVFLFTSLALVKRYSELGPVNNDGEARSAGRGYELSDHLLLGFLGTGAGQISVLVLTLYLNSPEVRLQYQNPQWLWLVCPLFLYWVSRLWMLAHRGKVKDDPVLFVVKDRVSYIIGGVCMSILLLAR